MAQGVIAHGDGIVVHVATSELHTVDQPEFQNRHFTPYSVFDPSQGVRYQKRAGPGTSASHWTDIDSDEYRRAAATTPEMVFAGNYRWLSGTREPHALMFKRKEQRVALLDRLAHGLEVPGDEYHAVRLSGSRTVDVFRLGTLQWKTQSANAWHDFAQYLQAEFALDRTTAWRLAWALVRAGYIDLWEIVEDLIGMARVPSDKDDALTHHLDRTIDYLKALRLT